MIRCIPTFTNDFMSRRSIVDKRNYSYELAYEKTQCLKVRRSSIAMCNFGHIRNVSSDVPCRWIFYP